MSARPGRRTFQRGEIDEVPPAFPRVDHVAKKRSNRHERHRTSTRPPAGRPPKQRPSGDLEDLPQLELLTGLDEVLRDPHPLALLSMASGIMTALDPRRKSPWGDTDPAMLSLAELCETFLDVGFRQTDALLLVLGAMGGDELLRGRIRRAVAERRHPVPSWLLRLDQVKPYRAVEMTHVLRDGDNVVIGVHLPGNRECSILVYIDHNMGTLVKDAFVLDRPLDEVVESWNEADPSSESEVGELSLADARARITPAIDAGAITFPPFESDTWPGCRPLVEWVVSMLPEGGRGYERPVWSEKDLARLSDDFFASDFARTLDNADHRALLESILWFGTDYGPGDPLRWSPVAVEILLADWIPRKLVAPADYLSKAPGLLRAFVRYCHAKRDIPSGLTRETLAAIDEYEPDYQEIIRTPRHQGAMALLERMGRLEGIDPDWDDGRSFEEYMLDVLAGAVGGVEALDRLGAEPLVDESFSWAGIPHDIRDRVTEVLTLVDGCCDILFDPEFRTASRRFLSRVSLADPEIFRRKGAPRTAAAAVCWVIGKANGSFGNYHGSDVLVKDLMAHFGLSGSVSQRAEVMLRAVGIEWSYGDIDLGDPALLTSGRRAWIVEQRDRYRKQLGELADGVG